MLDLGVKGGTPESACGRPVWTKRVTRWEWPQAGWLEPVACEALVRELLAAYRAGQPSDTGPRTLEAEVAAVVAEATRGNQHQAEGERVAGDDPLQGRFRHVQLAADGRQRDVDDREVRDRHEKRNSQHRERAPAMDLIRPLTLLVGDRA